VPLVVPAKKFVLAPKPPHEQQQMAEVWPNIEQFDNNIRMPWNPDFKVVAFAILFDVDAKPTLSDLGSRPNSLELATY